MVSRISRKLSACGIQIDMRYLVLSFFIVVSSIACGSQLDCQRFDVINNFSDSITNIIEGKKFLYYITGHHGHIWSLVVSEKDRYICVSGNTRNNDCRIDTIHVEASVLKWGLDTMDLYCHKMEPIENTTYWPFYERLVLSSSKKEIIFDSIDTNSYVGTDSVTFNNKLNELKYFMYWIAVPEVVRRKLPTPL